MLVIDIPCTKLDNVYNNFQGSTLLKVSFPGTISWPDMKPSGACYLENCYTHCQVPNHVYNNLTCSSSILLAQNLTMCITIFKDRVVWTLKVLVCSLRNVLAYPQEVLDEQFTSNRLSNEWLKGYFSKKIDDDSTDAEVEYAVKGDTELSALAFHPTRDMAVSSSAGGDFKVWVRNYSIHSKDQTPLKSGWRCHSVGSYKKKPMTAVAFSADGSVLAVAAETIITLWDPDKNVLVAVIGEALTRIVALSFVGKSEYIVSVSRDSVPQLSVWSTSTLSMSWSYKLLAEAVSCSRDLSCFAVLALFPGSCKSMAPDDNQDMDGLILLFNVEDPVPVGTWSVKKAKGGGISFLVANPSPHGEKVAHDNPPPEMLVYINGGHEYIVFDPYSKDNIKSTRNLRKSLVVSEETVKYGYASIYGELPPIQIEKDQTPSAPFVPSERPWETIFSGSSHVLPPLTKLCSVFLESLLEKLPAIQD
ncbi:Transducin family protein / WD-40 repeat family protein [Thalictrum thalictroides]|uniref:Transducin family protein / WD-40 repeat family protein n=1 Tax=Thalictrum thalictroides TaxID=46969 RepID=A0A7J6WLL7_THATH|nr:Transducin family protein / WD-40 repeat family protein [Thalictrum thalictroides]